MQTRDSQKAKQTSYLVNKGSEIARIRNHSGVVLIV